MITGTRWPGTSMFNRGLVVVRSSPDSPLEERGFELVVPPSFLSWPGRQRDHLDQRRGACPFPRGDQRFEPRLPSVGSGELPATCIQGIAAAE